MDPDKIACGGTVRQETLQIEPTVMDNVTFEDAVMQEENFWTGTSDSHLYLHG